VTPMKRKNRAITKKICIQITLKISIFFTSTPLSRMGGVKHKINQIRKGKELEWLLSPVKGSRRGDEAIVDNDLSEETRFVCLSAQQAKVPTCSPGGSCVVVAEQKRRGNVNVRISSSGDLPTHHGVSPHHHWNYSS
jgi:hypothetical protein